MGSAGEHEPPGASGTPEAQRDVETIRHASVDPDPRTSRIDDSRFTAGTLLLDRYRIIGRLGKGGMGEVYRADDLKLGQSVALKFLPPELATDPKWLRRLHEEVRIAREIAHPNVCRTYDIGEVNGEHFITMEYVDGEDLSVLLRRIGRLPNDKAIEIARQLCAGIAAAHDKNVLHRDLKPANIMLDGRGKVRITDFGIAALTHDIGENDAGAGTPYYMAPEQLAGTGASVRSDLYSLGLVLYEVFTGREPYNADSTADLQRLRRSSVPSTPSTIIDDIDPLVDRVIMRCLENDPADRPHSAIAVAAALPGGDPLAMALAAGEMPSPEMVAHAGAAGGLRPPIAIACLATVLVLVIGAIVIRDSTGRLRMMPIERPTAVLADRSQELMRTLGYVEAPADRAAWYTKDNAYLDFVEADSEADDRWDTLTSGRPPTLLFSTRTSPDAMLAETQEHRVRWDHPAFVLPGMARMQLDPAGRLVHFEAVPPDRWPPDSDDSTPVGDVADPAATWSMLFESADLDMASFTAVAPVSTPSVYCDTRAAWTGTWPTKPDLPLRVEAGVFAGRPVFFALRSPWDDEPPASPTPQRPVAVGLILGIMCTTIIGGGMLAVRNLRSGRSDRRGAGRLAVYTLVVILGSLMTHATYAPSSIEVFGTLSMLIFASGVALICWFLYVAIEPYARRYWPHSIISWTRLLSGRFRDPLVGRDVLFGCIAGAIIPVGQLLATAASGWMDAPPSRPEFAQDLDTLLGGRYVFGELFEEQTGFLIFIMFYVLLLLLRIGLRRGWLAIGVFFLIQFVINTNGFASTPAADPETWIVAVGATTLVTVVMVRFGLLTTIVMSFVAGLILDFPTTLDFSAWYAGIGLLGPLAALALAGYGFWIALAGQPLFRDDLA